MEETTENLSQQNVLTPEMRLKIFNEVNKKFTARQNLPIGMNSTGLVATNETIELIRQLESLDFSLANEGDIVWWLTKNSNNYFLVSKADELSKSLSGSFKSFGKDDTEGRSYVDALLLGASLKGSMLIPGQLRKGMSAEMTIPSKDQEVTATHYSSSATEGIGIIKGESITPIP